MSTPSDENAGDVLMESPLGETKSVPSFRSFTKAERIKQLNDIDKSITQLLQSAGLAIRTLTVCQADSTDLGQNPETGPQAFIDATDTYLKVLHSVDIRLKRQIYGLSEAGIIAMAKEPATRPDGQNPESSRVAGDNVAVDVGWLNSRSNKVGRDMEAELWTKARTFLEALDAKKQNYKAREEIDNHGEDHDMED